ncbi:MAG: transcriptional regulator [Chthonomonadales bacterium]|nr:transcriptional regulator [Chthonomonadales bacterium]
MDRKLLGSRIADRRNYLKMSQEDLAAMLHVTRESISNWETGRRGLDAVDMQGLATALQTTVGYFFGEFSSAESADDMGVDRNASESTETSKRLSAIEEQLQEVLDRLRQSDK